MSGNNAAIAAPVAICGVRAECLSEIFRDDVNLAIWQREPDTGCAEFATQFSNQAGSYERFVSLREDENADSILPAWALELQGVESWLADVSEVVEMFRCLFEPAAVGVRLHVLADTMCPRFHTDRVPARLLVTYVGRGTEWLSENSVVRAGESGPLPDQSAGADEIQVIPTGAVSLLKGEAWIGNEGRGLVHRSPAPGASSRLVLGLDWLS